MVFKAMWVQLFTHCSYLCLPCSLFNIMSIVQVCHEKWTTLEGLRDVVLLLEVKLMSSISINPYPNMSDALSCSNKWHSKKLAPNDIASIFITTAFEDK